MRCNNNGVVEYLDLSNLGMEGTISGSLADSSLSGLRSINLSKNNVGGSIPTSFNNAGALPNLQSLDLSSNQLVGGPADFGMQGMCFLEYLYVYELEFKNIVSMQGARSLKVSIWRIIYWVSSQSGRSPI